MVFFARLLPGSAYQKFIHTSKLRRGAVSVKQNTIAKRSPPSGKELDKAAGCGKELWYYTIPGNEMKKKTKDLLRISELAAKAGVSASTIKHYVNEGLIPQALKTGKNMAYYDVSCIEKIKLIKKIQKEKFLPLDVIKRIIETGEGFEEELELGKAILKTHRLPPDGQLVAGRQIEQHTGYPGSKIDLLEKEGLVIPETRNGEKYYDSIDCRIIEVMKQREETGVPLDYSVGTINIYRDAIQDAVHRDIRYFAQNLLGDVPTEKAVTFMTEADDLLYSFMVLYRQKLLRVYSEDAIRQLNVMPEKLSQLSFFPIPGREFAGVPEERTFWRVIHSICLGRYADALENMTDSMNTSSISAVSLTVVAHLLGGDVETAYDLAEKRIPEVTHKMMENAAATLACIFAIGKSTGISRPVYLAKRAMGYLNRMESSRETEAVIELTCDYIRGAVYTMLPDVFNVFEKGMSILEDLEKRLNKRKIRKGGVPDWFARTLDFEIFPAMEIRVNRYLAEGRLSAGNIVALKRNLQRIISLDDPSSENARWARMKALELG